MNEASSSKAEQAASMAARLAEWSSTFAAVPMPNVTLERARIILLDSLACALYAADDDKAQSALRTVQALGSNGDCTVIGTRQRTSLPLAAFANGVLVRTLDFNDTYAGPRQVGHPSDNISAALAAAELADRSGIDLIHAIRLGYEIYCRILDIGDPESPWDHVTVSGIVTAAMVGWLLRLPSDRLAHAISLSAMHCATLGEVRVGQVSGAKSIANAVVAQTAALLTLLAAGGTTGPRLGIEGARGYAALILDGADFEQFFTMGGNSDRLVSVGLKPYPCFALAQGPISAAVELRKRLGSVDRIERLEISLANTGPARLRLKDSHGRVPDSREAADHSIYFLVAVALLDGHVGLKHFESDRWQDEDVRALIARMEAGIDPALQPATSLPCRIIATTAGGQKHIAERPASPGNPASPLTWDNVEEKFHLCSAGVLNAEARSVVVERVARVESIPARALMQALVPSPH
jgi:2-methylcitrate dehydratase